VRDARASVRGEDRRPVRLLAVAAVVVAVVGGGVLFGALRDDEPAPGVRVAPGPPPVDATRPHVVVVPSVLPPEGGQVALVVANPTAQVVGHGVGGAVEVWRSGRWQAYADFQSSLSSWRGLGTIRPEIDAWPAIGLSAEPRAYGPLEWVQVEDLPAGSYRFSREGVAGVLEIREGAPRSSLVKPSGDSWLEVVGQPVAGRAVVVGARLQQGETSGSPPARPEGGVVLERLDGPAPGRVATLEPRPGRDGPGAFEVALPALDAGSYRLVRDSDAGSLEGVFLVLPALR
jgi:hypothetical protein